MSVRRSVLLTVYNRPYHVLTNTLRSLHRNDLTDCEIIIVDDGSTMKYGRLRDRYPNIQWITIDTLKARPDTYQINGFNNPSYAWNVAMEAARGQWWVFLSSDCIIPPHTLKAAQKCQDCIWQASIVDMDSSQVYLGKQRPYPMGWVMQVYRDWVDGGYDETFLKGIGYDDNDFVARVGLKVGRVQIDLKTMAFHQSHPQVAYSDQLKGVKLNELYIRQKWGGLPWSHEFDDPLQCRVGQQKEQLILDVRLKAGKKLCFLNEPR